MNAVVMDHVVLGEGSIVGALSLVKEGEKIQPRSLIAGQPARFIREVTDEMLDWKSRGTALYQALAGEMHEHWAPCEPLAEPEPGRPSQEILYRSWKDIQR
jgi:phenylacetic acid degradation protein/carnitine operon protein CaiE